jgi:ParB family chromosome partitioning protein
MVRREYRELDIADVVIKNRLRNDLGELGTLTNSIRKHGLLCPIVVDKNNVLIAGLRRIEACRQAGISRLPSFKLNTDYRDIEALDIQSDENICRQPLTQEELERQIQMKKKAIRGGPSKVLRNIFSSIKGIFSGKK